jgi:glyoxylase-like metal-dependent hydrolase (beta-lactamase superfamily II)
VRETGEDLHAPASDWTRLPLTQPLTDGEMLAIAGGFEVIHTPGHCAGQVALLCGVRDACCSRAMCA